MIKFYRVTPVSVLFFRDPRPFAAGEQSLARLQFPPRLTPFLGALRTKFLEMMAEREKQEIPKIFGKYEEKLRKFSIIWFSMLRDGQPILPLPFDAFTEWQPLPHKRFVYENPSVEKKALRIPVLRPEFLKGVSNPDDPTNELKSASYITIKGFINYKSGSIPPKSELFSIESLWKFENRVGIALKPMEKTAERSKFYRITVARPKAGIGFLVGVEFDDDIELPDTFTTRLGGEGHIVVWEKIDGFKVSKNSVHFDELVSLTHIPIKNDGEPKFEVKNWCINKLDIISGWDYKENRPKPLVKAFKPGAVLSARRSEGSKPPEIYKITFKNGDNIFVVKDLVISIKGEKLYLTSFEPNLGEPNTLFVIKNKEV